MTNYILALLLCSLPCMIFAQKKGIVIGVHDGDSITILNDSNNKEKIRLAAIDCPELKQPFGLAARERVRCLILGKKVTYKVSSHDRYNRSISTVYLRRNRTINALLIREGLAWHYVQYDSTKKYERLQNRAMRKERGLWSAPAQYPAEYRRENK